MPESYSKGPLEFETSHMKWYAAILAGGGACLIVFLWGGSIGVWSGHGLIGTLFILVGLIGVICFIIGARCPTLETKVVIFDGSVRIFKRTSTSTLWTLGSEFSYSDFRLIGVLYFPENEGGGPINEVYLAGNVKGARRIKLFSVVGETLEAEDWARVNRVANELNIPIK